MMQADRQRESARNRARRPGFPAAVNDCFRDDFLCDGLCELTVRRPGCTAKFSECYVTVQPSGLLRVQSDFILSCQVCTGEKCETDADAKDASLTPDADASDADMADADADDADAVDANALDAAVPDAGPISDAELPDT